MESRRLCPGRRERLTVDRKFLRRAIQHSRATPGSLTCSSYRDRRSTSGGLLGGSPGPRLTRRGNTRFENRLRCIGLPGPLAGTLTLTPQLTTLHGFISVASSPPQGAKLSHRYEFEENSVGPSVRPVSFPGFTQPICGAGTRVHGPAPSTPLATSHSYLA